MLHGVWGLPGAGIKPVSPALTGRFLTTGPPGSSLPLLLTVASQTPRDPKKEGWVGRASDLGTALRKTQLGPLMNRVSCSAGIGCTRAPVMLGHPENNSGEPQPGCGRSSGCRGGS